MHKDQDKLKNYYAILGVTPAASQKEIKAAWRKVVKTYHPDVCRCADSHALFLEVSEAYRVLQDEYERRRYDWLLYRDWDDAFFTRRGGDVHNCGYEAGPAEPSACLYPQHLAGLMLGTAASLVQYLLLNWYTACNTVFLYPLGYWDYSDDRHTS